MSQPIDDKILGLYAREQRTLARINGQAMAQDGDVDINSAVQDHPWLTVKSSNYSRFKDKRYDPQNLIASIFNAENGREMMYNLAKFRESYRENDLNTAAQSVIAMHGSFPDIDLRTDTTRSIKSLVRRLSIASDYETAAQVTEAYFSSFADINDTRVVEYKADCLRYIARYSGKRTLAERAIELYKRVEKAPNAHRDVVKTKISLCKPLITLQGEGIQ